MSFCFHASLSPGSAKPIVECEARYGAPAKIFETPTPPATAQRIYVKNGYVIAVMFLDHVAQSIAFAKEDKSELSDVEQEQLMRADGGSHEWKKRNLVSMDKEWILDDGNAFAFYEPFKQLLIFCTKHWLDVTEERKATLEKKQLEGF